MKRSIFGGWVAAALVAAAFGTEPPATTAPTTAPVVAVGRFPGGVVDAGWGRAYVTSATGEVDAVDLKTGKRLWSSAEAGVPVLVTGERLYMVAGARGEEAANEVHIVALDLGKGGKVISRSEGISLPEWCGILPEAGRTFVVTGKLEGEGLTVSWKAGGAGAVAAPAAIVPPGGVFGGRRRMRVRVVRPPVESGEASSAAGSVRVDLKSGEVKKLEKDDTLELPGEAVTTVSHGGEIYSLVVKEDGRRVVVREEKGEASGWEYGVR